MSALVPFETIPQLFHNLGAHFAGEERTVLRYRDRKASVWVDITWDELPRLVSAAAGYLHSVGVRPGDRVAILSENRPEWAITDLATQLLGGINVALYTSLPASQVAYILRDAGAKVFVVSTGIQLKKAEEVFDGCPELQRVVTMSDMRKDHPDFVTSWNDALAAGAAYWEAHEAELKPLADAVTPDDISALIYTSGTTGNPKGVMLTHQNFCTNSRAALDRVPFGPTDHHLSFLPLCHSFERTAGYTTVLACGAQITYAQGIDTVNRDLPDVCPTVMISVPRLFERIFNVISKSVEEGPDIKKKIFAWSVAAGKQAALAQQNGGAGWLLQLKQRLANKLVFARLHEKLGGNLRFAVSGGAALPRAIGEFFMAAGVTVIEGYGLTETSPVLTINPIDRPRYGTVGQVIPGVTVGIVDLNGSGIIGQLSGEDYPSNLSTGEGEIVARGPNIMRGYWKNDAATAESIDSEGWYHTGDVGRFDEGYLVITDRIKHMIVSLGGKNIYPGPIEEYFKTEPLIDQIMIVGEGREFLTALVVPEFDAVRAATGASGDDILTDESVEKAFGSVFKAHARNSAAHEKVRGFRLLAEPFTVDNGMMTPTLKLRRRAIEKQYAARIDEMYAHVI